ncbi:MAGUK p55 subfamily member 7 [Collichthys lucidus]|uniref:MAGUK p55 subfamily member 7 n=1 Tax=Collichthys lucidus TaxID=240159 RepID=A0A4U5UY45_COLLU|nr:MAGUK p55 subfamily member 7 [Collichthys lucidus]
MLSRTEHRGVCRLLSSVMSGTESHTDREEDYRFLHSMLMEKKLHLLFKIHERLKRFEKRSPVPVQEHAASLASDSLLSVHDAVAQRDFEPTLPPMPDDVLEDDEDSVKIVSLVKTKEPLLFLRALFDYDPNEDPTVPCKDAAVAFKRGDVLQIVCMEDDTWWQACHLGVVNTRAGLIPSQQLHERRVALQRPKALFKPRRVKPPVMEDVDYRAITGIHIAGLRRSFRLGRKSNRSRRWSTGVHSSVCPPTYIEVIPYHKDPQDRHRLVVMVGPNGVGVNELKRRLLISDPDHYGVTVPHTTREKRRQESEGVDYHFVSIHVFEEDILNHRFIEYGRYNGHYYGTSLDSVRRVMAEGKVCLLDVQPGKIKHVYTFEFKPYVVFVKPPRVEELRLTRRRAKFICDDENRNFSQDLFSKRKPKHEHTKHISPMVTGIRSMSCYVTEEDFEDMIDSAETMESQCGHLFDKVMVNGDIAMVFRELKADLKKVSWLLNVGVFPANINSRAGEHITEGQE